MTRILFIDPGPHVGAACWTDEQHPAIPDFCAWEWTPNEFMRDIAEWVKTSDEVGCENFRIGGTRGQEANTTIEMIGILRYLSHKYDKKFVTHPPGAHAFGVPKLKRLGWWTVGSDHARSASGHLVKYLADTGRIDPARLLPSDAEKEE